MNKEHLGALTDGIYAIAMTILVLELPTIESGEEFNKIISTLPLALIDYGLAFVLLFSFWYNQRRINEFVEAHSRPTLWLNAITLMLICLIPFAASSLYALGSEPTSGLVLDASSFVDLLFIGNVLAVDFCIHLSLWIIYRHHLHQPHLHHQIVHLIRVRRITTLIVILFMILSFIAPGKNRIILFVIPLLLIFEEEIVKVWLRLRGKTSKHN